MWSQLRIGMKSCSAMLAPPVWRERLVTTGADSSCATMSAAALQGWRMLAANYVAGQCAVVEDGWPPYQCAPHRVLAPPLIWPDGLDGSHTPECTHPRTPLFR